MKKANLSKFTSHFLLKTLSVFFFLFAVIYVKTSVAPVSSKKVKIYWFIPDGLRADRDQFNIFDWAQNGELPNLRLLMARGSYGYSRPVFPGHTPTNYATLLTGVYPDKHGVADGAMRTFGYPLKMVSKGGFSSLAKLVAPIWVELENAGFLVSLQSLPGSTPPEIFRGNVIKGRWGGWGVEFPSMVLETSETEADSYKSIGNNRRAMMTGPELTVYGKNTNIDGVKKSSFTVWGHRFDFEVKSGEVIVHSDKNTFSLKESQWSGWFEAPLTYQLKNDYQISSPKKTDWENDLSSIEMNVAVKMKLISLSDDGNFRLRILFDSLNEYLTSPSSLADDMKNKIGPMVDFVDNYPPQLVYHPKDKGTFIEEAALSWDWHQKAVPYLMKNLNSDFVIHSIYNPNQMLTSRWWLPRIDRDGYLFGSTPEKEKEVLWKEVKDMYRQMDNILGEIMKNADENTYIILSSDHGAIPLNKEVRLNNLFASKGWLKFVYNSSTRNFEIDWKNTKAIFLQMNHIYINPKGLNGPYHPQNSKEYYALRNEVMKVMKELSDPETGKKTLAGVWPRESVAEIKMPQERVGDLVIAATAGFSWVEDVSEDKQVFFHSVKGGYKQALMPEQVEGLLTPFVIVGPDIKAGHKISEILQHVDQYATIARITKIKHPSKPVLDGKIIKEIFTKEE